MAANKNNDDYEEMYGHYKPLFDLGMYIKDGEFFIPEHNYILDMNKKKKDKGEEMDTKSVETVLGECVSDGTVVETTDKESIFKGKAFLDCTECYWPPFVEWAHNNERSVLIKGKQKGSTSIEIPRLKHRPDLKKKYISENSTLPYVCIHEVNPNCGQSGIWKVLVNILKDTIINPELVIGYLNEIPVYKITGQGLPYKSCDSCGFKDTCEFKGECACVFRPQQCIIWGNLKEGTFLEIEKPLESKKFTLYDILLKIKEKDAELYAWFSKSKSIKEVIKKLANNIATMQRVSLGTYNCYGLPFLQCGMALNTEYNEGGEIEVWLSIGETTPKVASLRQYKKKLKVDKKLDEAIEKLSSLKKEGKL